ncbi:MAG: SDR family oxidoreductase [Micropruina sp.]|nr:SDR family oxidoreductase [Micropruina sp.]
MSTAPNPEQRPVALITGASRGIGRAIAADLGTTHHVLVGGRDRAAVDAVVATLPSAQPFVVELTDEGAVSAAVAEIGSLDVLVHSAGIAALGTVADLPTQSWRDVLEVNVIAPAMLTRLLLPVLRARQGLVVFINSGAGFTAGPTGSAYAASKFALRALADSLRAEERGQLRVTSIHPGRVDTDMQVELQRSLGRPYHPEEHLTPASVAATVRLAVDAPPSASIDTLSIRPA